MKVSAAIRKNQPPDQLMMLFQTNPNVANGNSIVLKRSHGFKPEDRRGFALLGGDHGHRLIKAEGHVPGLRGEDQHDGGQARRRAICGNTAVKLRITMGRKERIGTLCSTSSVGISTRSALRLRAAK